MVWKSGEIFGQKTNIWVAFDKVWKATANLIRYGRIKKKVRFDMSHLEQSAQQADEEL